MYNIFLLYKDPIFRCGFSYTDKLISLYLEMSNSCLIYRALAFEMLGYLQDLMMRYLENRNIQSQYLVWNKANLMDLIAATGLVILFKLDSNHRFSACVTLKFDGWHRQIIRHVFYTTSSFVYHFRSISEFKGSIWVKFDDFFSLVTLQFDIWHWLTIGQGDQSNVSSLALEWLLTVWFYCLNTNKGQSAKEVCYDPWRIYVCYMYGTAEESDHNVVIYSISSLGNWKDIQEMDLKFQKVITDSAYCDCSNKKNYKRIFTMKLENHKFT